MNNWPNISVVTAASGTMFDLALVKKHLNVTHDDEDALIQLYLDAAIAAIEGPSGIGVPLLTATYQITFDSFEQGITIPLCPVRSIESVTYLDRAGETQTLPLFASDLTARPVKIVPALSSSFPAARSQPGSVKVVFKAGFGDTGADVPADLRAIVLLMVANLYKFREPVSTLQTYRVPDTLRWMLDKRRVF